MNLNLVLGVTLGIKSSTLINFSILCLCILKKEEKRRSILSLCLLMRERKKCLHVGGEDANMKGLVAVAVELVPM